MNTSLGSLGDDDLDTPSFDAGDILFREGDEADAFYIVLTGKVARAKNSGGRLVVVGVENDKCLVGEDSVLGGLKHHEYGAVALGKTETVRIESSKVQAVIGSQSEWIKNILENISNKVRNTTLLVAGHRLEDDRLYGGDPLNDEQIALIKKALG